MIVPVPAPAAGGRAGGAAAGHAWPASVPGAGAALRCSARGVLRAGVADAMLCAWQRLGAPWRQRTRPSCASPRTCPRGPSITIENRSARAARRPPECRRCRKAFASERSSKKRAVAARRVRAVDWPCTGIARGDHPLAPSAPGSAARRWACGWRARGAPLDCTLRVYPNLRDRATAALFLRTADAGLRMRRQVGKGREFDNLRQYMPGDGFEDIHWKATARRQFPGREALPRGACAGSLRGGRFFAPLRARGRFWKAIVNAALHLALVARAAGRPLRPGHLQRPHPPVRARAQRHGPFPPLPRDHLQPAGAAA